ALKKTAKDTEQANAILTSIPNLDRAGTNVDTALFCKRETEQPEYFEEMAQKSALYKENIHPNEKPPNSRRRREGTGRVSSRRPFTIKSSSFGSNLNVQKDPRTLQDVDEFFAHAERQETAEAILRKMRGENSPVAFCSQQSLKPRVRRQGSGRTTKSKNFDLELLGNTEKYTQLDREMLDVEEEDPISTFKSGAEQSCEILIETGHGRTNKILSFQESGHEKCPSETVNGVLQHQRDVQLGSNLKNCLQVHDQHSLAHGGGVEALQLNPVQQEEALCGSEAEETVNMPFSNSFSSQNSDSNAIQQLIKEYMKLNADKTVLAQISRSGHKIDNIGMSYPKDSDCDRQYAFQQSQTESSNTICSQSLFTDEAKTIMQPNESPKNFHLTGFDRTPRKSFCQKPTGISCPLTSPTPPSKISAALKLQRKRKIRIEGKSQDACKSPIENRDEEAAKVHTSSHSHIPRRPHISPPYHMSGKFQASSPSQISRNFCLSIPLKKGESSGVRRLSFDSSSRSPKKDEVNSGESLNDARAMDLATSSKFYEENDRAKMTTTDVDLSNLTVLSPQKSTPVTKPPNFNVLVSEQTEKDVLGSASGKQIEESLVTLHKMNMKKVETVTTFVDLSNVAALIPQKCTPVSSSEPPSFNVFVSDQTEKDVLGCVSGEQTEGSLVTLHKKNMKQVETVTDFVDLSKVAALRPEKSTPVNSIEPPNFNILVSEQMKKDVLGSTSGEQTEESPITLHKKNIKQVEIMTTDVDLSNVTALSPQKSTPVNSAEPPNFNVLVSDQMEKDVHGSASGEQIEESMVTLGKENVEKDNVSEDLHTFLTAEITSPHPISITIHLQKSVSTMTLASDTPHMIICNVGKQQHQSPEDYIPINLQLCNLSNMLLVTQKKRKALKEQATWVQYDLGDSYGDSERFVTNLGIFHSNHLGKPKERVYPNESLFMQPLTRNIRSLGATNKHRFLTVVVSRTLLI
ncbi:hypothetical protein KI387_017522, partial [Taxus chinensis]